MMTNTAAAIAAILRADPTITTAERARFLKPRTEAPGERSRIVRFTEAAERLGVSRRTVSNLVAAGTLGGVKFPGRVRALGVRETDLAALIENKTGRVSA